MSPASMPGHVAFSSMSSSSAVVPSCDSSTTLATLAFTAEPVHGLTASTMPSPAAPRAVLPSGAAAGVRRGRARPVARRRRRAVAAVSSLAVVIAAAVRPAVAVVSRCSSPTVTTSGLLRPDASVMYSPLRRLRWTLARSRTRPADARPGAPGLGDPVEHDRQAARYSTHRPRPGRSSILVEAVDRLQPERAATDERGDDDDGQHHHDGLVDAEHDRPRPPAAAAP